MPPEEINFSVGQPAVQFIIFKWTPKKDSLQAEQINTVSYTKCIKMRILEEEKKDITAKEIMMEKCACNKHDESWENGSKFNLCLESEEGMKDQVRELQNKG